MVKAIRIHETGGPEVLRYEDVEVGAPGPGQARVRHTAIGLNFLDTYFRTGLYPAPGGLPFVPGSEGAGVVTAVGPDVTSVKPGDRVAYVAGPGAYAEERLVPADRLIAIPDAVDDRTAAAMMLKGMTVQYLFKRTFPISAASTILFHAAAGGVGLIAGQWAKHIGATIIGTVGSPEKAELARAAGYTHVIDYSRENFVDRVREITGGKGVDVVYDSVGKDAFPASLDCLRPLGMWVSFGNSSGPVPPFPIGLLMQKGSLFATRPTLNNYAATRPDLEACANDLIDVVAKGAVKISVNQTYPLAEAAQAHRDLEGRKTTGATVLIP